MNAATRPPQPQPPHPGEERRAFLILTLCALIALAAGWAVGALAESRTVTLATADGKLSVDIPAGWVTDAAAGTIVLAAYDPQAGASFHPGIAVEVRPSSGTSLADAAALWAIRRGQDLLEYRELARSEATLAGQPALRVSYGYIGSPASGSGSATLPVVVQATDVLVQASGRLWIVTTRSESSDAAFFAPLFERSLASARFPQGG
jgi:hypothetical protein